MPAIEVSPAGRNGPGDAGKEGWALTTVLARQPSVAGHVDKEHVLASVLLEGDELLPIEGEGSVLVDGAAHVSVAVRLEQKTSTGLEWLELEGNLGISIFQTMKDLKATPSFGTRLEPRSPDSLCEVMIMKALHTLVGAMET